MLETIFLSSQINMALKIMIRFDMDHYWILL
jgi:hypothetical protein